MILDNNYIKKKKLLLILSYKNLKKCIKVWVYYSKKKVNSKKRSIYYNKDKNHYLRVRDQKYLNLLAYRKV